MVACMRGMALLGRVSCWARAIDIDHRCASVLLLYQQLNPDIRL